MYSISISIRASKNFKKIEDYLLKEWNTKVLLDFLSKTEKLLDQIEEMPYSFPEVEGIENVRRALLTKHNFLFYRVLENKRQIRILAIIDTRTKNKHPKKLK